MVEAVEERQRVLEPVADVAPADARLRSARQRTAPASTTEALQAPRLRGGSDRPSLIEERHAARREARHPDAPRTSRCRLRRPPAPPVTARNSLSTTFRKSRGAKRSVGLTMSVLPQRMNCLPTSSVKRPRVSVAVRRRTDRRGPQHAAIREIEPPVVRRPDRACSARTIDAGGELNPRRRLDEHLLAREQVADHLRRIVAAPPAETEDRAVDESALRDGLCARGGRRQSDDGTQQPARGSVERAFTGGGSPAA